MISAAIISGRQDVRSGELSLEAGGPIHNCFHFKIALRSEETDYTTTRRRPLVSSGTDARCTFNLPLVGLLANCRPAASSRFLRFCARKDSQLSLALPLVNNAMLPAQDGETSINTHSHHHGHNHIFSTTTHPPPSRLNTTPAPQPHPSHLTTITA